MLILEVVARKLFQASNFGATQTTVASLLELIFECGRLHDAGSASTLAHSGGATGGAHELHRSVLVALAGPDSKRQSRNVASWLRTKGIERESRSVRSPSRSVRSPSAVIGQCDFQSTQWYGPATIGSQQRYYKSNSALAYL
jgi:hypothetical protein